MPIWVVLVAALYGGTHSMPQAARNTPRLLTGSMPGYPPLAHTNGVDGTVQVRVTTDGHATTKVELLTVNLRNPLGATYVGDLPAAALETARSWHFADHVATSFDVSFGYELRALTCGYNDNLSVTVELPNVRVLGWRAGPDCHFVRRQAPEKEISASLVNGRLSGVVQCANCVDRRTVGGASVNVLVGGHIVSATTAADGSFHVEGVQAGRYTFSVVPTLDLNSSMQYEPQEGIITVRKEDGSAGGFVVVLESYLTEAPAAEVTSANLPIYPSEAVATRVQGTVLLRLHIASSGVAAVQVISGPSVLARAAEAQVRSWHSERAVAEDLYVQFDYQLGSCAPSSQSSIQMNLPRSVALVTKPGCGPPSNGGR
jgi:hypothetical protein